VGIWLNHITGAILLDFYSPLFKEESNKLNRDIQYLVYCLRGARSARTLEFMDNLGFKEVYDLGGGLMSSDF